MENLVHKFMRWSNILSSPDLLWALKHEEMQIQLFPRRTVTRWQRGRQGPSSQVEDCSESSTQESTEQWIGEYIEHLILVIQFSLQAWIDEFLPENMFLSLRQKHGNDGTTTLGLDFCEGRRLLIFVLCNKLVPLIFFPAGSDRVLHIWSHNDWADFKL